MKFRLLVDLEVFEFVKTLNRSEQRALQLRFRQIQEFPTGFTDFHEYAAAGYRTEISICDRFAISFAVDHLDRHIKILDITLADTPR
jgi:hypothetical protein